ncbi:Beta-hexosaminidase, partial [Trema orientale]
MGMGMGMAKIPIRSSYTSTSTSTSNGLGRLGLGLLLLPLLLQVQVEVGLCGGGGVVVENQNEKRLYIWPMPSDVRHGIAPNTTTLFVPNDFHLVTQYPDVSGILKDAFARLLTIINLPHTSSLLLLLLQGLNVVISSTDEQLIYGVDESYNLSIPQPDSGNPAVYAYLQAKTVYGALHGLQTFSQLCQYNFKSKTIEVNKVPWTIIDQPRFSYRGLLIDTSRHYLPLPVIKTVIDSMAYAKL